MKFVKAAKPLTTKHPALGELSVEIETPQYDSLPEFVQHAGGDDKALEFINGAVDTAAKNAGRAKMRTSTYEAPKDGSPEEKQNHAANFIKELYGTVVGIVKDYTPSSDRTPSKARRAEAALTSISELVASGREFTREELQALLDAAKA
jgi:hypothetical protein